MFPWIRRYMGAGPDTFSDKAQMRIAKYAEGYASSFYRSFALLNSVMPNWPKVFESDVTLIQASAQSCAEIGTTLARVSGRMGKGMADAPELVVLDRNMSALTPILSLLANGSFAGGKYKENIANLEVTAGFTFKELLKSHTECLGYMASEAGGNAWKRKLGDLASPTAKNLGQLALVTLLGPAAIPGMALYGMGKGVVDYFRARTKARKESIGSRATSSMTGFGGYTPIFGQSAVSGKGSGGGLGGSLGSSPASSFAGTPSRSELVGGLVDFFGDPAYNKAKWTKEVIKLLRIIAEKSSATPPIDLKLLGMLALGVAGLGAMMKFRDAVGKMGPHAKSAFDTAGPFMGLGVGVAESAAAGAQKIIDAGIARSLPTITAVSATGVAGLPDALNKLVSFLAEGKKESKVPEQSSPTQPNVYDSGDVLIEGKLHRGRV
jgi:hypothetical protein